MKQLKLLAAIFVVCFAAGVAVSAMAPTETVAGPDPCGQCYIVDCGPPASCWPEVGIYRYYDWALTVPCEGPFTCKSTLIGCGMCW